MPQRDLPFLNGRIPLKADQFHAVEQRLRNRIGGVGRADKQHVTEVIGHVQIVVCERVVLLRVQHFQQGTGGIAVVRRREFIHLVQNHDRIRYAAFGNAVQNPSGHGADVRPPVAANIRLIPHAAQTDPHILPSQRPGDTLADAGLSGTRRAHEQQDRSGLLPLQLHHRDLLQNPPLDLFQSEVIRVQNLLRLLQRDAFHLLLFPGKRGQKFQIVGQHSGFVAVLALRFQAVQQFPRFLLRGLVHAAVLNLQFQLAKIGQFLRVHFIQFPLQILNLFAQRLLFVQRLLVLLLGGHRFHPYPPHLDVFIDHGLQRVKARFLAVLGQKSVALLTARCHPRTHARANIPKGLPGRDEAAHHLSPLKVTGKRQQRFFHRGHPQRGVFRFQVLHVGAAGNRQFDRLVRIDINLIQIYSLRQMDNQIPLRVDLTDMSGHANGIKAAAFQFPARRLFLRHDNRDFLVLHRLSARHVLVYVRL